MSSRIIFTIHSKKKEAKLEDTFLYVNVYMHHLYMYLSAGPTDEAAPDKGSLSLGEGTEHGDDPRASIWG